MSQSESERIREVYKWYDQTGRGQKVWYKPTAGADFIGASIRRKIATVLGQHGLGALSDHSILEVGCGSGAVLEYLVSLGATEEKVHGPDVIEARANEAQKKLPSGRFQCADASQLPY